MSRSIPCPKCGSLTTNISIEKALYIGHPPDQIFACYKCGKRVYGADAVNALVAADKTRLEQLQRAKEAEAAAKAAAAALEAQKKCAWAPCPNDHTPTSKYCSRTCSDRNAHAREKARKASRSTAPRSPTGAAPCPS